MKRDMSDTGSTLLYDDRDYVTTKQLNSRKKQNIRHFILLLFFSYVPIMILLLPLMILWSVNKIGIYQYFVPLLLLFESISMILILLMYRDLLYYSRFHNRIYSDKIILPSEKVFGKSQACWVVYFSDVRIIYWNSRHYPLLIVFWQNDSNNFYRPLEVGKKYISNPTKFISILNEYVEIDFKTNLTERRVLKHYFKEMETKGVKLKKSLVHNSTMP